MDRLGGLPEEVICHVLSFLPTLSLVQTSILAKQWRFLWTRVSVLGFNVVEHSNTTDEDEDITIFACNLVNAVIRLVDYDQLELPPRYCLFTSDTFVDLCIVGCGDHIGFQGDSYNFPALKKLQLVNVGYDSDASFAQLIAACPLLEELTMDRVVNMNILSRPHRSLDANKLSLRDILLSDKPKLRYLRIRGCKIPYIWRSWNVHSLDSLIEADIYLSEDLYKVEAAADSYSLYKDPYLPYVVTIFLPNLSNVKRLTLSSHRIIFLPNLSNVKRLTLSSHRIVDPSNCLLPDKPLDFPNLTELNLRADWCFVPIFFIHAKNLRVITIDHSMVDHHTQCWKEQFVFMTNSSCMYSTSVCPMDHLETVNLVDFEWFAEQEFEMVKYILRNAKVLKTMELIYTALHCEESDWNHKVEALNRLASFETPSTFSIGFRLSS